MGQATKARIAAAALLLCAICGCDKYDASLLQEVSALPPPAPGATVCGDGRVDESEQCDVAILDGMEGACPTACSDDDPCYLEVIAGYDCQAVCVGVATTRAINDDRCCPPGVGPGEDSDCGGCGDGIVGPKETCDPPEKCSVRADCPRGASCLFGVFKGDPEACTSECVYDVASSCEDGNNCCPAGCDSTSDNDCSASCGNQIVEPLAGETCEAGDADYPCAESCDDGIACTRDLLGGSVGNCNVECANIEIDTPLNDDGCCPPDAHAVNDSDCMPVCGNRVREGDESCDPCDAPCDDGNACTIDQASGNPATCSATCSHVAITQNAGGDGCCPPSGNANVDSDCSPVCGNGVQESGEACDGGGLCRDCAPLFADSLIHRYTFDGTGTSITDSIGSAHGTCVNCTVSSGRVDLANNISNNYVDLPNGIISGLSEVTVEVWLKWDGGSQRQRIFDFGNANSSGSGTSYFFLGPMNSEGYLATYLNFTSTANDSSADWVAKDTSQLNTSSTHHLAVTFDGSTLSLYLDGELQNATTKSSKSLSMIDDKNNWLGRAQFSNTPELDGLIYEFRIYNQALREEEISASYAAGQNP
jgi:hypothetical protein